MATTDLLPGVTDACLKSLLWSTAYIFLHNWMKNNQLFWLLFLKVPCFSHPFAIEVTTKKCASFLYHSTSLFVKNQPKYLFWDIFSLPDSTLPQTPPAPHACTLHWKSHCSAAIQHVIYWISWPRGNLLCTYLYLHPLQTARVIYGQILKHVAIIGFFPHPVM